jgi:hypothetical protein
MINFSQRSSHYDHNTHLLTEWQQVVSNPINERVRAIIKINSRQIAPYDFDPEQEELSPSVLMTRLALMGCYCS